MSQYISSLKLRYDPFEPGKASRDFFPGAERQHLLGKLIELCVYGEAIAAVIGPLGSGKTTIARELCQYFSGEAQCLLIPSTLFMNQTQFLDAVGKQLPKHTHIASAPTVEAGIDRICHFAGELDLEAQALILVVDDAHELSVEVLAVINEILRRSKKENVQIVLLGENPLVNLLQNTLPKTTKAQLSLLEMTAFGSEDTLEYIQFKLANAGFAKSLPVSGGVIGRIHNMANGIPGTINALIAEALDGKSDAGANYFEGDTRFISPAVDLEYDPHDTLETEQDMFPGNDELELEANEEDADEDFSEEVAANYQIASVNIAGLKFQPRYWIAACALLGVLLFTVIAWDSGDNAAAADVSQASATGLTRIELPVVIPESASVTDTPVTTAALANEREPVLASLAVSEPGTAAPATATEAATPATDQATDQATINPVAAALVTTPVSRTPAKAPAAASKPVVASVPKLPAYEQELLSMPASSYTIQLLGSHSEASVQQFIATNTLQGKHGYFETRHLNKPWFVVVSGSYRERSAATEVIDRLPGSIRDLKPWVRPVSDIQRDIRQLRSIK